MAPLPLPLDVPAADVVDSFAADSDSDSDSGSGSGATAGAGAGAAMAGPAMLGPSLLIIHAGRIVSLAPWPSPHSPRQPRTTRRCLRAAVGAALPSFRGPGLRNRQTPSWLQGHTSGGAGLRLAGRVFALPLGGSCSPCQRTQRPSGSRRTPSAPRSKRALLVAPGLPPLPSSPHPGGVGIPSSSPRWRPPSLRQRAGRTRSLSAETARSRLEEAQQPQRLRGTISRASEAAAPCRPYTRVSTSSSSSAAYSSGSVTSRGFACFITRRPGPQPECSRPPRPAGPPLRG